MYTLVRWLEIGVHPREVNKLRDRQQIHPCRMWQPHRREENFSPYHVTADDIRREKSRKKNSSMVAWKMPSFPTVRVGGEQGRKCFFPGVASQQANAGHAAANAKNGSTSPASPGKGMGYGFREGVHRPFLSFWWAFGRRRCKLTGSTGPRKPSDGIDLDSDHS